MKKRIESFLKRMTLEEKVSLLAGMDHWHTHSIQRPGIPFVKVTDGPHGARTAADDGSGNVLPATCFPSGVAMAATWNTGLVRRVGRAIGEEVRERNCAVLLGPCVNIHRSPLGGRNFESFSEDPYLSSRLAVAYIKGVQSQGVGVSVKHFALNNSEYQRFSISSEASERAIREIYFPSFESAVKEAQPWTVMCSYNKVNGIFASENKYLLTDVLKNEWGFKGPVISDWFALHSSVPAANAGLDLEMPGPPRYFGNALVSAVKRGEVNESIIDDKVRRILSVIFKSEYLKKKLILSPNSSNSQTHGRIAREAAEEAIVLLKNENHILPLSKKDIKTIAVIGPNAVEARTGGGGSSMVKPYYTVSPLEGIKKKCGKSLKIEYEPGCTNNRLTPVLDPKYMAPGEADHQQGLRGEYFDNNELSGKPVFTKRDTEFERKWLAESPPGPDLNADSFSVRWTGIFSASESGSYKFGLLSDGWARIYVEDKLVINRWGNPAGGEFDLSEETVGECAFEAGKSYGIKIEYCQDPDHHSLVRRIRIGCELPAPDNLIQRASQLAARSDVALVFAGLNEEWESEGFDRKNMDLPLPQVELIREVAGANPNTVVVLNNGSPVEMESWISDVAGVLETWYPGQECGNAIARVLFGEVNPSAKLTDTFPKKLEDNPTFENYPGNNGRVCYAEDIFVGYRHYDKNGIEPLFPFGYGLSFTDFEYRNLRLDSDVIKAGEKLTARVDIKNTGRRKGKETVQCYLHDLKSSLPRPLRELKGFQKISLRPGEIKTVNFVLDEEALSFYDPELKQWVAEPGEFEILIGASSRDIRAKAVFSLI